MLKFKLPPTFNPLLAITIATGLSSPASFAQEEIEELVVFGRNTDLIGQAEAASVGYVGGADLLIRPLVKTAELLESMPGMVAVQHSGSGKANQYFLRGFNLDHGTDYTVHLDGIPLNLRSHGHGQGYLDVNGLIPETVEGISYQKGPYRANLGDFSVAGASFIQTIDKLEAPNLSIEAGENGWQRYVAGFSQDYDTDTLTVIGEIKRYDGPWESPEDLEHLSLWGKYRMSTNFGQAIFTLSGYDAEWRPTEQIPERAIGTAVCRDAFCSLDPTARGTTSRWILNSQFQGRDWNATLYGQHYDWQMSSNPTYDFQLNQFDKRFVVGGAVDKILLEAATLSLTAGGDFRYDDASRVGLDEYDANQFVANISDNEIQEGSAGAFVETTWNATDDLRLFGGLRADYYDFDVTARNPTSFAGQQTDSQVSPKLGLAYVVADDLEIYANWGKGFHSNDARGTVNTLNPVPGLSSGEGHEFGARFSIGDFKFTSTYWWLDQDSELIFVGDSNAVEPKGGSEREGLELTMFWQPKDWLGIDAVFTSSDARYTDNPEGDNVEGAVEEAAQLGFTVNRNNWDASLRIRHLGPYALVADNSARADSLTTANLRGAYHWDKITTFVEVINLTDTDGKEIVYEYAAHIRGLDTPGLTSEDIDCSAINCRMSRATEPRTFRVGLSYQF